MEKKEYGIYAQRRQELVASLKKEYPSLKTGAVLLSANYESDRIRFLQDSTFYYFTGINEPGMQLLLNLDGTSVLYLPKFKQNRSLWVKGGIELSPEWKKQLLVDDIRFLGKAGMGYSPTPFFDQALWQDLLANLSGIINKAGKIFIAKADDGLSRFGQTIVQRKLMQLLPTMEQNVCDISSVIASMRRSKSNDEIESLYNACDITSVAHEAAASLIEPGQTEARVRAGIEYVFTEAEARPAYPSIVASGHNATVLHYSDCTGELKAGDLVVVDVGAQYEQYCADITRTYPVSGKFTARQRELYQIVLDTQEYIADLAKPGLWLSNPDEQDASLHHLACKFLKERGDYDRYFPHGLGHFLGLDVHDVGDHNKPLEAGDVITIEPGLYLPKEGIGIRIEDNFWITPKGAVCLSHDLARSVDDIYELVQSNFN
ncbi:M24 family metallopeptidase [bacterium]|nr:M24 family metallopeptidase [bacterium]